VKHREVEAASRRASLNLQRSRPGPVCMIMGSPLSMAIALRGFDRMFLGIPGWQDDADAAIAMAAPLDSTSHVLAPPFEKIAGIITRVTC
jgi:adenylate cyclase